MLLDLWMKGRREGAKLRRDILLSTGQKYSRRRNCRSKGKEGIGQEKKKEGTKEILLFGSTAE